MLWLLFLVAVCWLYYVYYSIKVNPGNVPVYPGRLPVLGNIMLFTGDSIDSWENIKRVSKYTFKRGNVCVIYFGMIPFYVITDPDDCCTVLSTFLHKPGIMKKYPRRMLGNGLLVGPVSVWKEHRKLLNPTFNQQVLDTFMDIFNSQSRRLVDSWRDKVDKGPFNQQFCLEKNTLETICLTTAGVDISNESEFNEKCLEAYTKIINSLEERGKNLLYYFEQIYNMTELGRTEAEHARITRELTDKVLKRKKEEYVVENNNSVSENKFKPFLHRLLDLSKSELSDKDIQDEMNNIILTGFETSSGVVTYILLLLGTYPEIQEKCLAEIREIFGDSDRDVTKEDLSQLKYLEAVMKETLRLCPVAPITGRIITNDIRLKNATLRKGHLCVISLYGALHHPSWGEDVEQFVPERWLEPTRLPGPNAMAAFGFGRRNCIGRAYAFMTMKVTLVHVLRMYQVHGNYHNMRFKNHGINKPAYGHEITIQYRK